MNEISKPIQRDDRPHIDYVPTQVVTEFIRSRPATGDVPIDGIKYLSAVHPSYASYVIFATQENLFPDPQGPQFRDTDRWLELTSTTEHEVGQDDINRWKKEIPEQHGEDYQELLYGDG